MVKEMKYKVGDKVLIEAEITQVDGSSLPYRVETEDTFLNWFSDGGLDKVSVYLPPKPKVTQELMDWYENSGKELDFDLFDLFTDFNKGHYVPSVVYNWLTDGDTVKNNQERQYALATLLTQGPEAVEVVEEPRYVVALPDYGRGEVLQLWKAKDGELRWNFNDKVRCGEVHKFTESEIKNKDERFWVFAQPIEELG